MSRRALHQDDIDHLDACVSTFDTNFPDYFPDASYVHAPDDEEEESDEDRNGAGNEEESDGSENDEMDVGGD